MRYIPRLFAFSVIIVATAASGQVPIERGPVQKQDRIQNTAMTQKQTATGTPSPAEGQIHSKGQPGVKDQVSPSSNPQIQSEMAAPQSDETSTSTVLSTLDANFRTLTQRIEELSKSHTPPPSPPSTDDVIKYLLVVALAAGFGGVVHGMTRQSEGTKAIVYTLRLPFFGMATQLGFLGDMLVGSAGGTTIFFFMESVFGLRAGDFAKDPQAYLKFVALGVICGYMGSHLLDTLALAIDSRLLKFRTQLVEDEDELQKAKERLAASSEAVELVELAEAYRNWKMYEQALNLYDDAIRRDPENPHHYLQKSFVYADLAKLPEKANQSAKFYEAAADLTDRALKLNPQYARALYDRACYRHLGKLSKREDVMRDLEKAFGLSDTMRKMAQFDEDLRDLKKDESYLNLIAVPHREKTA